VSFEGCSGSEPDNKEGRLVCRGVFCAIRGGVDDPFLDFDFVITVCYRTFDAFTTESVSMTVILLFCPSTP
jgi:hypothetical protein